MTTEVNTGRVKWFNGKRGFGFITNLDDDSDVFVHHTGLSVNNSECWKNLFQGEYVEYTLSTAEDGSSHAKDVTGIRRGPLMCESNHDSNRRRRRSSGEGEGESEETPASE